MVFVVLVGDAVSGRRGVRRARGEGRRRRRTGPKSSFDLFGLMSENLGCAPAHHMQLSQKSRVVCVYVSHCENEIVTIM